MSAEPPYHIRTGNEKDAVGLRTVIGSTLSRPEGGGRRTGYRAAADREELLVLERYDAHTRDWAACAFVVWHIRVDDVLTIRDAGTEGAKPHPGMVKQLILELLRSLSPVEAIVKVRRDSDEWNEILSEIAGFVVEGGEYRRPYWINIWRWTRQAAVRPARGTARPARRMQPR
ncbi:MAG: hypothetical protein EXR58_02790 [Chloroflexi bacterium]|nr:hypothetical protein [Chloroflexota bacterium]